MSLEFTERISIQVSLSGYSFTLHPSGRRSLWLSPESIFSSKELSRSYDSVELSLLTPKCTLVPSKFFDPDSGRAALADVCKLDPEDKVSYVDIPSIDAVLVYSLSIGETLSGVISRMVLRKDGSQAPVLPEMYYLIQAIGERKEYNRILASFRDGHLYLVIAQGRTLRLANVFDALDFTTAEYFIFLSMKSLQLNPEVSTISFRTPVTAEEEISLCRYFKAVEMI